MMVHTEQAQGTKLNDPYLENFERLEAESSGAVPSWIFPIRKAGISRFAELGFPTLANEDWRYTNVAPIAKLPFRPSIKCPPESLARSSLAQFTFSALDTCRLVFVNGHFSAELSSIGTVPTGVKIGSLAEALQENSTVAEKHLARYADEGTNAFAALNSAFLQDGAFIFVSKGNAISRPVHLVFLSTARQSGVTSHPRNLIVMERDSRATILETHVSLAEAPYLTNAVTEVVLEENSALEHCKVQDESVDAFHMATIHAQLGRDCRFTSHSIAMGARLSRNNIKTVLDGEGVECVLNGLYLTKDQQLADHYMIVEHAKPHCNSHEYFNGILEDHSRGVFHGRILVQPQAQKTDAKQTNKNLLLSDNATVDTKPQLEIYADDVKCTHGATIGQLNEESIFYLRARGIGTDTARRMLIHAFAGEITDRIQHEAARGELDKVVWDRLEQNPQVAEVRRS
jgi:Fe-S cluster assembly protein SufD